MEKSQPRVPLPATIDLPGSQTTIQVNHCKMPDCANFGVPARTKQGKTCGVRIAIHDTDAELIVTSCEKWSGLITIRRQCVISSFFSFTWS